MSSIRVVVALSLLLAGCGRGASGPPFTPATVPADQAALYVYRESSMMGAANVWALCLDGDASKNPAPTCVNVLRNGGYVALKAPAGSHRLWAWMGSPGTADKGLELNVEAGHSYYLRFYNLGGTFAAVPEKEGLSEIRGLHESRIKQ